MPTENTISFIDNPALKDSGGRYITVMVSVPLVLKSWKKSLYSYEWLCPDGTIKPPAELPESEQGKRRAVEQKLRNGQPLDRPVLGIGVMENIEIGIGRAEFLTLAANGFTKIPVHIPKSGESDFKVYQADVKSQV